MSSPLAKLRVRNGTVLVAGDGHYWPGVPVPAHDLFVQRVMEGGDLLAIIYNGDALDGARISRHARIGWESRPELSEELAECQKRMGEIEDAAPEGCPLFWTLGNHDMRFETRLAGVAPEYERIKGIHLKDHFPAWKPCWGVTVNGGQVVVKHKLQGGVHARRNNVIKAGSTVVTGHTHRLGVTAVSDYAGTRYGVEHGMLGNPRGPQFQDYTEAGPVDWQMGWVELTFERGRLLWPQVCHVEDGR